MKKIIQRRLHHQPVKETFDPYLEAMASGVPVLGYAYGAIWN
jgi:hypothetical protein